MIGLSWSNEAMHMAKRLGIMTLYFSAIDRLMSKMLGRRYRHEDEWKRIEEMLKKGEWRFEF